MQRTKNSVVATFDTHTQAEKAIRELQKSGFDLKKLSIIGKGYESEEHVIGYYNLEDRVKYWGSLGAFWGGLWGLLFGSGMFFIPGLGPVVIAGPLIAWLTGVLEGALVVGGLSAIGAALYSIGIPKDSILKYEESLKVNKFLLIVHGANEEVEKACEVFSKGKAVETNVHQSQ